MSIVKMFCRLPIFDQQILHNNKKISDNEKIYQDERVTHSLIPLADGLSVVLKRF